MAIPTYDKLMLPLLQLAGDGQKHGIAEAYKALAAYLNLSAEEVSALTTDGRSPAFNYRVRWAKTYLTKAKLLESTGRGLFQITQRGLDVLNSKPASIDPKFLLQFPEFSEFKKGDAISNNVVSQGIITDVDSTPEEVMLTTYQQIQSSLTNDLLDYVLSVSPAFFEQLVIDLLLAMGYGGSLDSGQRIGQSGDGGIDGYIQEDKLGLDIIYIQAKRWARGSTVGRPDVQAFVGSLMGAGSTKGVFITTSDFSDKAYDYAQSIRTHKIILINGEQLARLMIEHNVGVSVKTTYVIKQIDENYFPEA